LVSSLAFCQAIKSSNFSILCPDIFEPLSQFKDRYSIVNSVFISYNSALWF
jgi:hypothetical protein